MVLLLIIPIQLLTIKNHRISQIDKFRSGQTNIQLVIQQLHN